MYRNPSSPSIARPYPYLQTRSWQSDIAMSYWVQFSTERTYQGGVVSIATTYIRCFKSKEESCIVSCFDTFGDLEFRLKVQILVYLIPNPLSFPRKRESWDRRRNTFDLKSKCTSNQPSIWIYSLLVVMGKIAPLVFANEAKQTDTAVSYWVQFSTERTYPGGVITGRTYEISGSSSEKMPLNWHLPNDPNRICITGKQNGWQILLENSHWSG